MVTEDFFVNELLKLPSDRRVNVRSGEGRAWMVCYNPDHAGGNERTPSMTVNLNPSARVPMGYCSCFGCKFKAPWNDMVKHFKREGIASLAVVREGAIKEASVTAIFRLPQSDRPAPILETMMPWSSKLAWRGIPGKTMAAFGARAIKSRARHGSIDAYFPVHTFGEYVGGVTAVAMRTNEEGEKAYVNWPGKWVTTALFGFDVCNSRNTLARRSGATVWRHPAVFVVEGPRDCLHLQSFGFRAVALLGTTFSKERASLIETLDPPLVVIATDADEAGDAAADRIKSGLPAGLRYERLVMPEGSDPADLTPEDMKILDKMLSSVS